MNPYGYLNGDDYGFLPVPYYALDEQRTFIRETLTEWPTVHLFGDPCSPVLSSTFTRLLDHDRMLGVPSLPLPKWLADPPGHLD